MRVDTPIGPGTRLLQAVRRAVRTEVIGTPAQRIVAVGESRPELVQALITFAAGMTWVKTATGAAGLIEAQAETLAAPAEPRVPAEALFRNLRQRIATLEAFNPDDDQLEVMRAELAQMEGSQAVRHGAGVEWRSWQEPAPHP